jgi:hypothetical protein
MSRAAIVPNPARLNMRPVELITDRAKRYRANANPPPGPRRCNFCTSRKNVDIDHVTGDEAQGSPRDLIYLCRRCNASKAHVQARANIGKRTAQYNPSPAPSFQQFLNAALILRGDQPGDAHKATGIIWRTSPAQRVRYAERIEQARRNPETPTFQQYAFAVSQQQHSGAHGEAGAIIHATPPELRSEYARKIAAGKRTRRHSEQMDAVPF